MKKIFEEISINEGLLPMKAPTMSGEQERILSIFTSVDTKITYINTQI
jgi:hypothetical protein